MSSDRGFRIESVSAFTQIDDNDVEGVLARRMGDTFWPLVMADEERLVEFRPYAEAIATATGKPVKLSRYTTRVDVEVIEPEAK